MRRLSLLYIAVLAACDGIISAPLPGRLPSFDELLGDAAFFACHPDTAPADTGLRRLSREQYGRAIGDTVRALLPGEAALVLEAAPVAAALSALPDDLRLTTGTDKRGGTRRLDQFVHLQHAEAHLAVAVAVGAELTASPARLEALLGDCATDGVAANDAACLEAFIARAGRLTHRRSLDPDDVAFYLSVYDASGIDAAGIADVVTVMLAGPRFFFVVEHGAETAGGEPEGFWLDDFELAARLALHFWGSVPDATLLDLAEAGELRTEAGFDTALLHVLADPRLAESYGELFREWTSVEDLPELDRYIGAPNYDEARGELLPTAATRENMIDEVARLGAYYATSPSGVFDDLFNTTRSFATTPDLASIYGAELWDGAGEPPPLPDPSRAGILVRAGLLATAYVETRPVVKGVVIRTAIMCDDIPDPPSDAMTVAAESTASLPPVVSTREYTRVATETQSRCASCHASAINPLGFITEGYDSFGRARQRERVIDDNGLVLGEVPVDTTVVPQVVFGDPTEVSSIAQLNALMLESHKPQRCLARKYYRFTMGRSETPESQDGCLLSELAESFQTGVPLGDVLAQIARSPLFQQRRFD